MVLLVSCVPLAITPALAVGIPGDTDEDDELTEAELTSAILSYMLGKDGHLELGELRDAAHVYVYWDGEPRTITDSADREVTIYKPIKRVVCTLAHHIEALRILKVSKGKIVGVPSSYLDPDFFPEFDDVQGIGHLAWDLSSSDIEMIVAQDPDVVFLPAATGPSGYTSDGEQELLEAFGITVLRFTFNQLETIPEEIEKCGYIFEKEEKAEEFIDWHDDILNSILDVTSGIGEAERPKVYSEYLERKISVADDEIIATAGGKDIFAGKEGEEVDKEAIMHEDPEIIIRVVWGSSKGYGLDADDTEFLEDVRRHIMEERAELQNVSAVMNGCVYIITSHIWTYLPYSGCKPLIGLCYLAKWFHPEPFPDTELDPKAIHQEYLTRFQGLDIDLDEKGVFVYLEKKEKE
jgi:iron complex transport system substrate-binding protein